MTTPTSNDVMTTRTWHLVERQQRVGAAPDGEDDGALSGDDALKRVLAQRRVHLAVREVLQYLA